MGVKNVDNLKCKRVDAIESFTVARRVRASAGNQHTTTSYQFAIQMRERERDLQMLTFGIEHSTTGAPRRHRGHGSFILFKKKKERKETRFGSFPNILKMK